MNKLTHKLTIIAAFAFFLLTPATSHAASLYPDLITLPPTELQFAVAEIDGEEKHVLRFTNSVWNAGQGPLEMYGETNEDGETEVTQRIYDTNRRYTEHNSGNFVWHEAHNHWHFEKFAEYQLWTRKSYDEWLHNGRKEGEADFNGYKTTFCIRETELIDYLPNTPYEPVHTECGQETQGLSVGWGDTYRYDLPEQWIELGDEILKDGDYVLRSVVDPEDRIKESPNKHYLFDSPDHNEGVTYFEVYRGHIYQNYPTPYFGYESGLLR